MNGHRYILEKYKGTASRFTCPSCKGKREFSRYVDTQTGLHLADHVGRCNREDSCGHHYSPKEFFKDNPGTARSNDAPRAPQNEHIEQPVSYLPLELMIRSVEQHRKCNLYPFLVSLFGEQIATDLCSDYFIGANKGGDTVFWQVDVDGQVRQAKIISYNPITGKRSKEQQVRFAGKKILGNNEANLKQCFFGEYLLSYPENDNKRIAICESEKTAIILSVYFPQMIWLATGGKHGARWTEQSVCKVLKNREVILYPDLQANEQWKSKSKLLASTPCKVFVSDVLEKKATKEQREQGLDLADFLIDKKDSTGLALADPGYPVMWDYSA